MSDQNTLKLGSWNVICDRCGFKMKADQVKREWNGLYTCKDCWEPRHPSDFFRAPAEDTSVPFSRPDTYIDAGPYIIDTFDYVIYGYVQ